MNHTFELTPRDVLFFRDARPMEASDAGLGANWPRPDQLYNALHNAFLAAWPERQPWEGAEHTRNLPKDKNQKSSFRFGALKTAGPFPKKGPELYLPCPLDVGMDLVPCAGTDLPAPLTHAFRARSPEKRSLPQWISATEYARYLAGSLESPTNSDAALYGRDRAIGVAIDPETLAARRHQLYQAEYLRLQKDVTMAFSSECDLRPKGLTDIVDVWSRPDVPSLVQMGGQQGLAYLTPAEDFVLPSADITGSRVRWTLLTPAVFGAGWLPGWCKDSRKDVPDAEKASLGTVMLRKPDKTSFVAKLIAARIGKPIAFSGWDLQANGPKPTVLAVPAGSSYVFECESVDEAKALAAVLNFPNRRSDLYGEKGFGIGICSNIQPPTAN